MTYYPLDKQVSAVEREINLRRKVYPWMVSTSRMVQETADYEIGAMMAVLDTLISLSRFEETEGPPT